MKNYHFLFNRLFVCMLLALLLACSKDGDPDSGPQSGKETTINFKNELSKSLPKVLIGTYRETSAKLVKNYGTLAVGASTGEIPIDPEEDLVSVFLYFEEEDKVYYTSQGFLLDKGTKKNFTINSNTSFSLIEKTSFMYPQ